MRRVLYIGILAAACGGGSDGPSGPPTPTTVSLVSGGGQTGSVGLALSQPLVVRVSAGSAPASGVRVTFAVATGGGAVSPTSLLSDASGNVSVSWVLGGTLGEQSITATAASLSPITISATATAGPPAILLAVAGNTQFAVVGRAVTTRPRVQLGDAFGNPIAGRTITFKIAAGAGVITDSVKVTDAAGLAELGSWVVGPAAGINKLNVSLDQNITTDVIAIGTPASIVPQAGNGQTINVGTKAPVSPAVLALDGNGQPLANVEILFAIESGGGTVSGAVQKTDAQGIAKVGSWVLGLTPGENALSATTGGVPATRFTAQGVPGIPAALAATSAANASGLVGNFLATTPSVLVTDAAGHAVAGTEVTFEVTSGGGTVATAAMQSYGLGTLAGALASTNSEGEATLAAWRLGPATGPQTVRASAGSLTPVIFTANAEPLPNAEYHIEIRYQGTQPTAAQRAAFEAAVARWEQIVLGDVSDELAQFPAASNGCYPALDEVIDDLIIYAELVAIDGAGGILGSAGPCLIRDTGPPGVGHMRFDTADLASLEAAGQLDRVILHEMGHVLGFGSLWDDSIYPGLLVGAGSSDPYFAGPAARAAWRVAAANITFGGNIVPVENTGGPGTRDSHWRESIARNELMTGFLNNGANPLSAFTIGSLRDMGYVVNDAVADDFQLLPLLRAAGAAEVELREVPLADDIQVIQRGRIVRTLPRKPF